MRITRTSRLALLAIAALAIGASTPAVDQLTIKVGSRLWFDGTSTVRDWTCAAGQLDAVIDAAAGAPGSVLAGQKAVNTVTLTIPVARLNCNDNRTMNGHMLKALNATRHPTIEFSLLSYEIAHAAPSSGTLQGTLMINGTTRPVTLPVEFEGVEGALRVTGNYALKMTEWGVVPPKLMMGALKVGETVTVRFDLLLQH